MSTTVMRTPAVLSGPQDQVPARIEVRDALIQDLLMATDVTVDASSPNPVAVFENSLVTPVSAYEGRAAHEALVVVRPKGSTSSKLMHVYPDPKSSTGWAVRRIHTAYDVSEVAVDSYYSESRGGYAQRIWCVFVSRKKIYCSQLVDGRNWSAAKPSYDGEVQAGLRNKRTFEAHSQGMFFRREVTAYAATGSLAGKLFYLASESDNSETRLAAWRRDAVTVDAGEFFPAAHYTLCWAQKNLSLWTYDVLGKVQPPLGAFEKIVGTFTGRGMCECFMIRERDRSVRIYWICRSKDYPRRELHGGGTLPFPAEATVREVQAIYLWDTEASSGDTDLALINLYGLAEDGTVWVVRQNPDDRYADPETGIPNWLPAVPVSRDVAFFAVVPAGRETAMFYTQTGKDNRLKLLLQDYARIKDGRVDEDQGSGHWRELDVHAPSSQVFEVARHRVEAVVSTGMGVPAAHTPITLSVEPGSSACEVFVNGSAHRVAPESPACLKTDAQGRISVSVTPNGLAAPHLKVTAGGIMQPFQPGAALYHYLSGAGSLNPTNPGGGWGIFDAEGYRLKEMLRADNPGLNQSQAREAATAIQQVAIKGLTLSGISVKKQVAGRAASGGAGMWVNLSDSGPWETRILYSREELANLTAQRPVPGGFLGGLLSFAGDVWRSVRSGGAKLVEAVFDWGKKTVTLALQWIGEKVEQAYELAFRGIEEAGHFILGVIQRAGGLAEKIIDRLKGAFQWEHIWDTKMAFERALTSLGPNLKGGVERARTAIDTWLQGQQETLSANIDDACKKLAAVKLSDTQDLIKKQLPGVVGDSGPITGPLENWLMDQVASVDPPLPAGVLPFGASQAEPLLDRLKDVASDFENAATSLYAAMKDYLEDPLKLKSKTVADLLKAVKGFAVGLLKTARFLLNAVFDLLEQAISGFSGAMTAKLSIEPLNTLWKYLADAAGRPKDGELTLTSMFCLLAAIPVTIAHKLLKGSDARLFPTGTAISADGGRLGDAEYAKACHAAAGLMTIVSVPVSIASDFVADKAPRLLGLCLFMWAIIGAALAHVELIWQTVNKVGVAQAAVHSALILLGVGGIVLLFRELVSSLWDTYKKFLPLLLTVFGSGALAWSIWAIASGGITDGKAIAASLFGTVSLLFSFLTFEAVLEASDGMSLPVKGMITAVGGTLSGGLIVMLYLP